MIGVPGLPRGAIGGMARARSILVLLFVATGALAACAVPPAPIPDAPPRATVWLFIATDCPIANGYQPELEELRRRWEPRGIAFVGVYAELPVTDDEVAGHVREHGIRYPVRVDADRALQRGLGVRVVPEVVVTAGGPAAGGDPRAYLYRGRIDDRWPERGSRRASATTHDLADALADIVAGRAPHVRDTAPVGCVLDP